MDHKIGSFTIQENEGKIYATDINGGDFLYVYQFPKQPKENKTTKTFENKYFRLELPNKYELIPEIKKSEVDNLRDINGDKDVKINSIYFYNPDRQKTDKCQCVIQASMLISSNSHSLMETLKSGIRDVVILLNTIQEIDRTDSSRFISKRQYKSTDPRGDVTTINNAEYFWLLNDRKAFRVSTTCENDTYCMETLDDNFNNFEAK